MRILFASHVPLVDADAGGSADALADGLVRAGHSLRAVVVDGEALREEWIPTRRVVCRRNDPSADLPFALPRFVTLPDGRGQRFADLSDEEFVAYRQALRVALDDEIAQFDPQIVHCEHIWLMGHLALESGVPYVLTAYQAELDALRSDARFRRLAEEAAENAGRVIVANEELGRAVHAIFGDLDGRVVVVHRLEANESDNVAAQCALEVADIYRQVLDERLGRRWHA
jgi:hypothetical protein